MSKGRPPSSLRLEPIPAASAQARRYVRDALQAMGAADVIEAAELGVSELVTNACLHAGTTITVAISRLDHGRIRIGVTDCSPTQPEPRRPGPTRTTGRGLALLAAYGHWGVTSPVDGSLGKTVWFEPHAAAEIPRQATGVVDRSSPQIRR